MMFLTSAAATEAAFDFKSIKELMDGFDPAALLPEKDATPQALFQVCCGILHDPARQREMAGNMAALGVPDAAERILDTVRALL